MHADPDVTKVSQLIMDIPTDPYRAVQSVRIESSQSEPGNTVQIRMNFVLQSSCELCVRFAPELKNNSTLRIANVHIRTNRDQRPYRTKPFEHRLRAGAFNRVVWDTVRSDILGKYTLRRQN